MMSLPRDRALRVSGLARLRVLLRHLIAPFATRLSSSERTRRRTRLRYSEAIIVCSFRPGLQHLISHIYRGRHASVLAALNCVMTASNSSNMSANESTRSRSASSLSLDDNTESGKLLEELQRENAETIRTRQEEQAKRDEEMDERRREDLKGGKKHMDEKYKALMYLLNQSKVCGASFI
jgi:hypothetical protein